MNHQSPGAETVRGFEDQHHASRFFLWVFIQNYWVNLCSVGQSMVLLCLNIGFVSKSSGWSSFSSLTLPLSGFWANSLMFLPHGKLYRLNSSFFPGSTWLRCRDLHEDIGGRWQTMTSDRELCGIALPQQDPAALLCPAAFRYFHGTHWCLGKSWAPAGSFGFFSSRWTRCTAVAEMVRVGAHRCLIGLA